MKDSELIKKYKWKGREKKYMKEYKHTKEYKERAKKWREDNSERMKVWKRAWYERNKEWAIYKYNKWKRNNKEKRVEIRGSLEIRSNQIRNQKLEQTEKQLRDVINQNKDANAIIRFQEKELKNLNKK